jgi:hypothetical protein
MLERSAVKVARSVLRRGRASNRSSLFDIKAYKKVEKLNRTMKSEEIAQILGMGKSLVDEYIRIINEE